MVVSNMTKNIKENYFLVGESVLPQVLKKTIQVKELLRKGSKGNISQAVKEVGISRSAYYKYKDHIYPFYKTNDDRILSLNVLLEDKAGALSKLLKSLAKANVNILTINQNIPLHGTAAVSVIFDTQDMLTDTKTLIEDLYNENVIKSVEIIAQKDS